MIHRLNLAIQNRALYPDRPAPPIPETLLQFTAPPPSLVKKAKDEIDALTGAAEVKKGMHNGDGPDSYNKFHVLMIRFCTTVPPKAKGKRHREVVKPISGLDVDALLGKPQKAAISSDNSVPDFKRFLAMSSQLSEIEDVSRQIGDIIRNLVTNSFGDALYSRAMENLGVMRLELINMEEPELYNHFIRDFKKSLLSGEIGGDRRDFWLAVKRSRLGLIDKSQSSVSTVTDEEVEEVWIPSLRRLAL